MAKYSIPLLPSRKIIFTKVIHSSHGAVTPISKLNRKFVTVVLPNGKKEMVNRKQLDISRFEYQYLAN